MPLTQEQLSVMEKWLQTKAGQSGLAALALGGVILSVWLPDSQLMKLALLGIVSLGLLSLALFLRTVRLNGRIKELDAEILKLSTPKDDHGLTEIEFSLLSHVINDQVGFSSLNYSQQLKLEQDDVDEALVKLVRSDLISQEWDHERFMVIDAYHSTRKGRLLVRDTLRKQGK